MDPALRKTMRVRGDLVAIIGFTHTSLLNLQARGVKAQDVVVLPCPEFGVKLYEEVAAVFVASDMGQVHGVLGDGVRVERRKVFRS